ncbi:MAG TPA: PDZ domain-containing protein [Lacipirellulaceae bacterium]|nr:PDZ domain-containing protein [Lacipirellulaceae bacterium]
MSTTYLRGATNAALITALVLGGGVIARAQTDNSNGKVVRIGHADAAEARPNMPPPVAPDQQRAEKPDYWIGLLGGAIPADNALRAQLNLPEHQGLLVAGVVPNSPAEKAGLKKYDILMKANGADLHEMTDLVNLVKSEGAKNGHIALDVLRSGKHVTVQITPEKTPDNAPLAYSEPNEDESTPGMPGMPRGFFQQFGGNQPFDFRSFGPGVIVGGGQGIANMPNGVSINIQKQNDQPTHITVKRGNDTWDIVGDDPESLKKLPNDLRPFVEQMLHGQMNMPIPPIGPNGPSAVDGNHLRQRMERMEQQLQEMQRRLLGPENAPNNGQQAPPAQTK